MTLPLFVKDPGIPEIHPNTLPLPSTLSVHVAPSSVYHEPNSIFTIPEPLSDRIGAVVSGAERTFTVRDIVPVFPAVSTFLYWRT